jgi:hypothetical protein
MTWIVCCERGTGGGGVSTGAKGAMGQGDGRKGGVSKCLNEGGERREISERNNGECARETGR